MRIFIDTGIIPDIEESYEWGLVQGVTTNPSLVKKFLDSLSSQGKRMSLRDYYIEILRLVDSFSKKDPVSLEVVGTTYDEMLEQALTLYNTFSEHHPQGTHIKIPVNPSMDEKNPVSFEGLKVIEKLSEQGIPVNCTLINRPEQGVAASMAGAKIISLFAGRIDDMLRKAAGIEFEKSDYFPADGIVVNGKRQDDEGIVSGVDLVRILSIVKKKHKLSADILAASVRNLMQMQEFAYICNADIATVPYYIIKEMNEKKVTISKDVPQEFQLKKEAVIDNSTFDTSIIDDVVDEGIEKHSKNLYHPKTMEGMVLFTNDAKALKELYSELFAAAR